MCVYRELTPVFTPLLNIIWISLRFAYFCCDLKFNHMHNYYLSPFSDQTFVITIDPIVPKPVRVDISSCIIKIAAIPIEIFRSTSFSRKVFEKIRALDKRYHNTPSCLFFEARPECVRTYTMPVSIEDDSGDSSLCAVFDSKTLYKLVVRSTFACVSDYVSLKVQCPLYYVSAYLNVIRDQYVNAYMLLRGYYASEEENLLPFRDRDEEQFLEDDVLPF